MNKIKNPHNNFFVKILSNIKVAQDFFNYNLPIEVRSNIDLNTLKICKDSFIKDNLKNSASDILYKVKYKVGQFDFLYLHLEHQSTSDKYIDLRILKYKIDILDLFLAQHPNKQLPVVYSIVFYHGKKGAYFDSNRSLNHIMYPSLARDNVKSYFLIDINKIKDKEIVNHGYATLLEFLQKHIYARDFIVKLNMFKRILLSLKIPRTELIYFKNICITYIMDAAIIKNKVKFLKKLYDIENDGVGMSTQTLADYLRAEGMQQGILKGVIEGKIQVAKEMLKQKLSLNIIEKTTGLSPELLSELQEKCD